MTSDRERQLAALVIELIAAFDSGAPLDTWNALIERARELMGEESVKS